MAKLSKSQLLLRRKVIISEIKRIATKLNKPIITQYDFLTNAQIKFPEHAFVRIFGGFRPALEAAGMKKKAYNFYQKRNELEQTFKQIARNNGNRLSLKILVDETGVSPRSLMLDMSLYFGGIMSLCKRIKCSYSSNNISNESYFKDYNGSKDMPEIRKEQFAKRILEIAQQHNNSLSMNILLKNYAPANTLNPLGSVFYGGFVNMCRELGITWVNGNHGIDEKELAILKDIRDVYKANDNQITRTSYVKKGKYSLEAIEDYFGSFGKACLEVNIRTEAMKA